MIQWHIDAIRLRDELNAEGHPSRKIVGEIALRLGKKRHAVWSVLEGLVGTATGMRVSEIADESNFIEPHKPRTIRKILDYRELRNIIANREGGIPIRDLMARLEVRHAP
jgi:hypothetical protein